MNITRKAWLAGGAALLAAQVPVHAQTSDESAQGDVSVTIYNNGQALVQDVRQIDIAKGRSRIEFPDVSAQIRPQTLSFSAAGTGIVEQNFDFDLLTPAKLMEKSVGRQVTLVRTNPATGAETRERATVLSTAGGTVVKIGDRIEVLRDDRKHPGRDPPRFDPLSHSRARLVGRLRRALRRGREHDRHAGLGDADQHYRHEFP